LGSVSFGAISTQDQLPGNILPDDKILKTDPSLKPIFEVIWNFAMIVGDPIRPSYALRSGKAAAPFEKKFQMRKKSCIMVKRSL
jgi:hypothetical protein